MAIKKISKKFGKGNNSSVSASAKTDKKQSQQVTANPRLIKALKTFDRSKEETKTYLVDVAVIVQEESLSKEEVIASLMEARGIERMTAGQQYSRMKKILNDPETLEELRTGIIDLATARAKTKKGQKNPSTKQKQKNAEKTILSSITRMINACKEKGMDLTALISTIREAAKKAGLK